MSPLGTSLALSWCAWNYKSILIVFSGEPPIRKIHLLNLVYQDAGYSWWHLAIGPLITAAFYVLVFPYPSNWVYSYSLKRRKEALSLKRQIDDQTVLTQEESRALRNRFLELEAQHMTESVRLSNTNDSLKNQLSQLVQERDALAEELAAASRDKAVEPERSSVPPQSTLKGDTKAAVENSISLDKSQLQMLEVLGRYGSNTRISTLSDRLSLGDAAIWYIAGRLEDMGLAKRGSIPDRSTGKTHQVVSLTDDGLRLFMESIK
ncbi:hypothetical protein L0938_14560 [Paracidovorax citrulli]